MPLDVDLSDILDGAFRSRMDEVHTSIPGRVAAYYPATQTVDVQPTVKRVSYDEDGTRNDDTLPILPQVPVCWPSGGGFFISFPIAAGDHVLVVFSEAATGDWRASGNVGSPSDTTRHGLGGAFAIPGANPDAAARKDASGTTLVLGKDGATVQISIDGSAISLGKGASDFVALASLVKAQLDTIATKFDAHTHAVAGAATGNPTAAAVPTTMTPLGNVAATLVKAK